MRGTHIWWIRRDIRLQENLALTSAIEGAEQLIPLFILEPELLENAAPRRRAFLLNALADLDRQLQILGSRLIVRQGPALSTMAKLLQEMGKIRVFAHEDYTPFSIQRDKEIAQIVSLKLVPGILLREP